MPPLVSAALAFLYQSDVPRLVPLFWVVRICVQPPGCEVVVVEPAPQATWAIRRSPSLTPAGTLSAMLPAAAVGPVVPDPRRQTVRLELPLPRSFALVAVDDEVLLSLLRADGHDRSPEAGASRRPTGEARRLSGTFPLERHAQCLGAAPYGEAPGRQGDLEVTRRRPDEGGGVQRRTQLPRQESRCVVCLCDAESGELGDGEKGGEKERGGDREENRRPEPAHGLAPGFRRAETRPQVREARHVFSIHTHRLRVAP